MVTGGADGGEGSLRIPVDAGPSLRPLVLSLYPTSPSSPWETPGVQLEAAEVLAAAAGCPDGAGLLWSCGHQRQGLGCPLAGLGAAAEPLPLTAVHV